METFFKILIHLVLWLVIAIVVVALAVAVALVLIGVHPELQNSLESLVAVSVCKTFKSNQKWHK